MTRGNSSYTDIIIINQRMVSFTDKNYKQGEENISSSHNEPQSPLDAHY